MEKIVSALLILVGIIHLLPVSGVLGIERLHALYGVTLDDPNLVVLMRHRAVLFAIVGLLLVAAAFHTAWQWPALSAGFISVVAFQALALSTTGIGDAVRRVVLVDWVALAALLAALALKLWSGARSV